MAHPGEISAHLGAVRGVPGVRRVQTRRADLAGDVRVHGGVARTRSRGRTREPLISIHSRASI